jgi:hypothetical protein
MCDSYEARLVELFDAFKRREREGTKRVKESLNPEMVVMPPRLVQGARLFRDDTDAVKSDESVIQST